jgi:probable rRNA maturation factor
MQKSVTGLGREALARFVSRASRTVKLQGAANVLVTGNRTLQRLNKRFRRQNKPTDILSFPAAAEWAEGFAGDIAISADIAKQNARRLGHSTAQEVKILALHGLLHLAGYDHERDRGEMARTEQRVRKRLGLRLGLMERTLFGTRMAKNASNGLGRSTAGPSRRPVSRAARTLR